jgi:hypothetical protein
VPDRFWAWDGRSAATVDDWAPAGSTIVGGNLELRRWLDGTAPGAAEADRELDEVLARPEAERYVVLALSGEESDGVVEALLDIVAAGPPAWQWGIRCHPTDRDWRRWEVRVAARGLPNVEARRTTELPLFAVLARASAVVTRHSSVTLDALAFGVRSVLLDAQGAELFADQVTAGDAVVAGTTPSEACAAVAEALVPTAAATARPDVDRALDQLLEVPR